MLECVRSNFGRDAELRQQLLATGDRLLQEGWPVNDGFWGIGPSGKGRSELGKILMRVRAGVQEVQQDEQQTHICAGNMTCKFLKRELRRTGHLTSGIRADLVD